MSERALFIASVAELDFGAVASKITAWASGSFASGKPKNKAESTRFFTIAAAFGNAIPISSLAIHKSLLQIALISPAFIALAR